MRAAYQKFSGRRGYTPDEFRAVAEQVAGVSLASFWDAAVEGTAEVDYAEALELLGLRFRPAAPTAGRAVARCDDAQRRRPARRLAGSPRQAAAAAGLNVDDEILAIDDFRVRADQLAARLDSTSRATRSRCSWRGATS